MSEPVVPYKNPRKLRNLFVFPKGRLRVLFGLPVGLMAAVVIFLVGLNWRLTETLGELLPAGVEGSEAESILASASQMLYTCALIIGSAALFLLVGGLWIIHRFYGPQVQLLRVLRGYAAGDYKQRVTLRKEDELKELAQAVNELGEALAKR